MKRKPTTSKFITLIILILLSACESDEVQQVDDKIVVEDLGIIDIKISENSSENSLLISLEDPKVENINKIEFFLNDQLIGELEKEPFELEWKIENYISSELIFRVDVESISEDHKESILNYEPLNTLLEIQVEQGFYDEDQSRLNDWVFISDLNGNLVSIEHIEEGQNIILERPSGYFDHIFHITHLSVKDYSFTGSIINTYTFVMSDKLVFKRTEPFINTDENKSANFTISNLPESLNKVLVSSYYEVFKQNFDDVPDEINLNTNIYDSSSGIYLSILGEGQGRFAYYEGLNDLDETDLNYTELQPLPVSTIKLAKNNSVIVEMYGINYLPDGKFHKIFTDLVSSSDNVDQTVETGFPEGIFDDRQHIILIKDSDKSYLEVLNGGFPSEVNYPDYELVYDYSLPNNVKYSAHSNFDYIVISIRTLDLSVRWNIYGGLGSDVEIDLPAIPEVIVEEYPWLLDPDLTHYNTSFEDYIHVDGYKGYIQSFLKEGYLDDDLTQLRKLTINPLD